MKRDDGSVHRMFSFFLIIWIVILFGVLFQVAKAGLLNRHLEDSLMQANLSAILIDPYQYGATKELVFANIDEVKERFEENLWEGMGSYETMRKLGIVERAKVQELRLYERKEKGICETVFRDGDPSIKLQHSWRDMVVAPDGTFIETASIYAKIAVPVRLGFGMELTVVKEHCVDVLMSGGMIDEET